MHKIRIVLAVAGLLSGLAISSAFAQTSEDGFAPLLSGQDPATEHTGRDRDREDNPVGAVYVASNSIAGNEVLIFPRDAEGRLGERRKAATGGRGTGGCWRTRAPSL